MPFRDLISRLKDAIKPRDQERESHEDDNIEELLTSSKRNDPVTQDSSQQPEVIAPKPTRGLRKASVSNRRSPSRETWSQPADPEPLDYLYFGEGTSAADISQSLRSRSQDAPACNTARQPPIGTHNNPIGSGKNNSGFLETGLSTHTAQMSYSNLTYGGSLQYDYTGTQGPGFVQDTANSTIA